MIEERCLCLGSVVLLEPTIASYGIFNAFVCSQQPFGIPGCHSGFDEQPIVLFYYLQNPETKWTHISQAPLYPDKSCGTNLVDFAGIQCLVLA